MRDRCVVEPGSRLKLADRDPRDTFDLTKADAKSAADALDQELASLQEMLYAARRHSVLVVLQGMDTSGKDGTIKHVMDPVNPQGIHVQAFKVPTSEELAHDFLWRVHKHAPERGMLTIFNRSHYEDVLVVRVHDLVPRTVWSKRYRHINEFENLLADSSTIVLKFFLHISEKEQEERLVAREKEVEKAWKLAVGDWKERRHWGEYTAAYEDAISKTSTKHAPWFVVPADRKWLRNHVVSSILVETLRPYRDVWAATLDSMSKKSIAELEAFRKSGEGGAA